MSRFACGLAHGADVRQLAVRRRIESGRFDRQQAVFLAEGVDDLGHRAADRDDAAAGLCPPPKGGRENDDERQNRSEDEPHCTATPSGARVSRSEEHTSELQSLLRISYAVFCLNKNKTTTHIKRM